MNNEQSYYARMCATMSDKLSALEGQIQKGMRVLDFGSGPSDDVYEYVRHFEANYYALDNSRQVQMLLEEKGIHCIDLAFLKSTDMQFDIIFMSSVFHELLSYLSRNEAADTMNVVLSRLAENGKLIKYNAAENENERPAKITYDGKEYEYVGVSATSAPENGNLKEGTTNVVFEYKLVEKTPEPQPEPGKPEDPKPEPQKPVEKEQYGQLPKTGIANSSALLSVATVLTGAMGIVINSKKRK